MKIRKLKAFYNIEYQGNLVGFIGHSYFYNSIPSKSLLSELVLYPAKLNPSLLNETYFVYKEIYNLNTIPEQDEDNNNIELLKGAFRSFNLSDYRLYIARQGFEIILFPEKNDYEKAFIFHEYNSGNTTPFKQIQMEPNSILQQIIVQKYEIGTDDRLIIDELKKTLNI